MQCFERHKFHLRTIILCFENHFVRILFDVFTEGLPDEMSPKGDTVENVRELRGRHIDHKRFARGRQPDFRRGAIIHPNQLVNPTSCNNTCVIHLHHRWLVVARRNRDLHVADQTPDQYSIAPLLNQDGDVVFACHQRRIPREISSLGIDGDVVGRGRQRIARNILPFVAAAVDKTVRQAVAFRIVCAGIVVIGNVGTGVVQRRIQQLRRGVSTNERIDNQDSFNEERNFHRTGDVHNTGISVRIFEGDMKGAGGRECVLRDVHILTDIVFKVHLEIAVDNGRGAVAPKHLNLRSVGGTRRVGICRDGELVGKPGYIHIADFASALVRGVSRVCGYGQDEDYQKNTQ